MWLTDRIQALHEKFTGTSKKGREGSQKVLFRDLGETLLGCVDHADLDRTVYASLLRITISSLFEVIQELNSTDSFLHPKLTFIMSLLLLLLIPFWFFCMLLYYFNRTFETNVSNISRCIEKAVLPHFIQYWGMINVH